jgi:NADH-quinone oxidoreductase subunit L
MTVGLGVSAYSASIFHLMTHAFFKALLFLAAGSVIMGMHHEQDMRRMGGLARYMPITYLTCLIGSLALIGFPGLSGFYSKDAIIEAVAASHIPGAGFAYWMVLLGVFVTAFYSFRLIFMVFHGEPRMDHHTKEHLHESPWVVTLPLILLAIPSVLIGGLTAGSMLFGDVFNGVIHVDPAHDVLGEMAAHWHGPIAFLLHSFTAPAFYLAIGGVLVAWYGYLINPKLPARVARIFMPITTVLEHKYWFDDLYLRVVTPLGRLAGKILWSVGDRAIIDGALIDGTADRVGRSAELLRKMQSGYLYHYAFAMVISLALLIGWVLFV